VADPLEHVFYRPTRQRRYRRQDSRLRSRRPVHSKRRREQRSRRARPHPLKLVDPLSTPPKQMATNPAQPPGGD